MDSLDAFAGTYNQKLSALALEKRIPISGTFELLPSCNMRCRMCYIQHALEKEKLQPVEFWEDLFDQAIQEGLLFPLLTGGEPFLYPEFEALYERLIKKPVHLVINTNATLLDREKVKWLAKMPPRRLNISIYGASDDTYAKLCGHPDGFTKVMRAFDLLQEYGIPYRVHGTMVPENGKDYQEIVEICNARHVPLAVTNYVFPPYRKEKDGGAPTRFTPMEYAQQAMRNLKDQFIDREKEYMLYVAQRCAAFEHPEIFSLYGNDKVSCRGGICTFWVDWRGNISGCGIHDQNGIDLHNVSFKQAWQQVKAYTDSIRLSEKCKICKYRCICNICAAAAFCETGCMEGTPEYLCEFCEEYARLLMEERSRLFGHA